MKAIVYTKFGSPDVLQLKDVENPVPKDNEILIRVQAASAGAYDWRHLRADPFLIRLMGAGLRKSRSTGSWGPTSRGGSSGRPPRQAFQPGDEVFGDGGYGGFAEYVCVDENEFVLKPAI